MLDFIKEHAVWIGPIGAAIIAAVATYICNRKAQKGGKQSQTIGNISNASDVTIVNGDKNKVKL